AAPRFRSRAESDTSVRLRPPSRSLTSAPPIVPRKASLVPLPFGTNAEAGTVMLKNGGAAVRERDGDILPGEPELRERQQDAALEGQPVMPAARPPQAHPAEIEGADVRDRPLVADRVDGAGRRRALRPAV